MTNITDKVMYIGVTNDLFRRIYERRNSLVNGFTKRYRVHKLVYYEEYTQVKDAIMREKRLKGIARARKNALVETLNPKWEDLTYKLFPELFQ